MASHVLLALDDTEASRRAVGRVADAARERRGAAEVTLFHVLPPIPPGHLEHGGGDTPEEEREKDARHAERRARWVEEARRRAQPLLDAAAARLRAGGVAESRIHHTYHAPDRYDETVAQAALDLARERGCDTIVVGRESWPWYRELVRRHVSEDLAERADGIAVEVVG